MIKYLPLFSGSSGNSSLFGYGNQLILVDAGKTASTVVKALAMARVTPEMLSGVLISHEHTDHCSAAGVLARKYGVPIYANAATWEAMTPKIGDVPLHCIRSFDTNHEFYIDDVSVSPFQSSHDAADPVCFMLRGGENGVLHLTDTGLLNPYIMDRLRGIDIAVVETNYDPDMLKNGPYPLFTKERILSEKGHLSNMSGAAIACKLCEKGVSSIVLGHISKQNNTPEMAYDLTYRALEVMGFTPGEDVTLSLAPTEMPDCIYKAGE